MGVAKIGAVACLPHVLPSFPAACCHQGHSWSNLAAIKECSCIRIMSPSQLPWCWKLLDDSLHRGFPFHIQLFSLLRLWANTTLQGQVSFHAMSLRAGLASISMCRGARASALCMKIQDIKSKTRIRGLEIEIWRFANARQHQTDS